MGTTTSRPILHGIESFLLRIAQFIDVGVRFIERLFSSIFSLCLPSTIYQDYPIDEGRDVIVCDKEGVCVPATKIQQHAHFKQRYEDRLKRRKLRAEWAAAGLDVIEMERQEQAKRKRQQQKAAIRQMNEKQHANELLGPVAQAPLPRPEHERETAAERAKGKLWVMGNVAPKEQTRLPKKQEKPEIRMPEMAIRRRIGPLESVRETSFHESSNYPLHGHGGRIASGISEHGDISYQIVATSRDHSEAPPVMNGKAIQTPDHLRKVVTTQGIMPSQAQAVVSTSSASRLDALVRPSPQKEVKVIPSSSPSMKLVQPTPQRHRQSIDFISLQAPNQPFAKKQQHAKSDPVDLRADSPRFFNRARASLDMVTNVATQMSRPSSPSSPALPPFSSASSDAGSIASRRSLFGSSSPGASISRSSTPPCVTDLADRACKSRWEANSSERKVWKNEVDRITLHKLQQTSKRHRIDSVERLPISKLSESTNLAQMAEKRLRRVSLEPKQAEQAAKTKRRSVQVISPRKNH